MKRQTARFNARPARPAAIKRWLKTSASETHYYHHLHRQTDELQNQEEAGSWRIKSL